MTLARAGYIINPTEYGGYKGVPRGGNDALNRLLACEGIFVGGPFPAGGEHCSASPRQLKHIKVEFIPGRLTRVAVRDRVVLADEDDVWRKNIGAILTKAGFLVIGEASDGITALKIIRARQPELVVADVALPGISGLELARIVYEDRIAPVLLTSSTWQQDLLEKAKEVHAFGFLVKPVDEATLLPAADVALALYQELQRLTKEVRKLREALETRKVVERAKGILMETLGLTEAEAYRRIQKQSMNRRLSMRAVAEAIILAHGVGDKR